MGGDFGLLIGFYPEKNFRADLAPTQHPAGGHALHQANVFPKGQLVGPAHRTLDLKQYFLCWHIIHGSFFAHQPQAPAKRQQPQYDLGEVEAAEGLEEEELFGVREGEEFGERAQGLISD